MKQFGIMHSGVQVAQLAADDVVELSPPVDDEIILDRGAYLPVPPRILVEAVGGLIVQPMVFLTQGDPHDYDPANDPNVFNQENTYGADYPAVGFALDFVAGGGPVPPNFDSFDTTTRLSHCRGIIVRSAAGQQCVGTITIPDSVGPAPHQ